MPRIARMTTVNINEMIRHTYEAGSEDRTRAEMELAGLNAALTDATVKRTELERAAAEAAAAAQIAASQAELCAVKLLRFAGRFSSSVAVEKNWLLPYINEHGDVILENPMTVRDQRVAARNFHQQLHQSGPHDPGMDIDLFGPADES